MREPAHAADGDRGDGEGGEDSGDGEDARRLERRASGTRRRWRGWCRMPARPRSPCTAGPRRRATAARPTGIWWRSIADDLTIPVFGSGDCIEPEQIVERLRSGVEGVLVGRGVLRNPWILAQAADLAAGRLRAPVTLEDRGRFCSTTSSCCCTSASTRRARRHATTAGWSTSCARSGPGTQGPRQRLASAHGHQQRRVAAESARHDLRLSSRPKQPSQPSSSAAYLFAPIVFFLTRRTCTGRIGRPLTDTV